MLVRDDFVNDPAFRTARVRSSQGPFFGRVWALVFAVVVVLASSAVVAGAQEFSVIMARAQRGDCNAQSLVAHNLLTGQGVDKDERMARYWYRRVIENPDADAKIIGHANLVLGFLHYGGKGGTQDYEAALHCFEKAAAQGFTDAHISIGLLYAKGWGVDKDYRKALSWWQCAERQGHPTAAKYIRSLKDYLQRNPG